jgi:hypothetical protein
VSVTEWLLFIDESGDFDDPDSRPCTAGLLLQDEDASVRSGPLRRLIEQVAPLVPYPLHAAHLNRVGFHLACRMRASGERQGEAGRDDWLDEAVRLVRESSHPVAGAFLKALGRPGWLDCTLLRRFDAWLKSEAPPLFAVLAAERDAVNRAMWKLLDELHTAYGPDRCLLIAAAEGTGSLTPVGEDRYLRLLTALFERVFALLRSRPAAQHRVWVRVAGRNVREAPFESVPQHSRHVADCIRAAERFPLWPPAGATDPDVRLVPFQPARYDESVHPGLVLADFIANRLWMPLQWARDLRSLEAQAQDRTALSIYATPRALPASARLPLPAAEGLARQIVNAAFSGRQVPAPAAVAPGWAREQALAWARAAREDFATGGRR